ncbi:MAG TPA: nicotinate-nucleotide diphosphorylase (carboxylating), partial [Flavobacteriales bacterium]|nr:nicotinate-nucleotide diphosphorylase (carboxylating) [Flavobacteriales bacterium]
MLPTDTEDLIDRALKEDLGVGDHTTLATIPAETKGTARLLIKEPGILAGMELADAIFKRFDPGLTMKPYLMDGARVAKGDIAFNLFGSCRSILMVERVVLNFMQRMSGIATLTQRYVQAVEGTGCRILDTRKTTPGLRGLEKWAVR